jgi:hypothetical protein
MSAGVARGLIENRLRPDGHTARAQVVTRADSISLAARS